MSRKIYIIDRKWEDGKHNTHIDTQWFYMDRDGFEAAKSYYLYNLKRYEIKSVEMRRGSLKSDGTIVRDKGCMRSAGVGRVVDTVHIVA